MILGIKVQFSLSSNIKYNPRSNHTYQIHQADRISAKEFPSLYPPKFIEVLSQIDFQARLIPSLEDRSIEGPLSLSVLFALRLSSLIARFTRVTLLIVMRLLILTSDSFSNLEVSITVPVVKSVDLLTGYPNTRQKICHRQIS